MTDNNMDDIDRRALERVEPRAGSEQALSEARALLEDMRDM